MDFITVLSFTIFGATVVTIVMALVSYGAFKLREWRKPMHNEATRSLDAARDLGLENRFFKKYLLPEEEPHEREA